MYDGTPHIAFIGRSNVGKSTTINTLLGRKKLVKTGRTPGKTREINFFKVSTDITQDVYFVDLPGYGYAKVSKTDRQRLRGIIEWYISHPASDLELVVLIIDAKAGLTDFDKQMFELMDQTGKNYILAVNKIDKLNQKGINKLKKEIKADVPNAETGKNVFYYSAFKNKNIHLLRDALFGGLKEKE
ncbi:MAG: ribosome biogenesis GTP-binding protein YihA/YsxC [Candidatus Pacebacteria bacterium]|nr:ribosome biogenesis GTP-binding protein YihA/YsxC [Candidatus Paceibacterota bacterium]